MAIGKATLQPHIDITSNGPYIGVTFEPTGHIEAKFECDNTKFLLTLSIPKTIITDSALELLML